MNPEDANAIVAHASHIGDLIEKYHPAVHLPGLPEHGPRAIPRADVDEISDVITMVVAQILQSWLNAGSERDVTYEELGPEIRTHLIGWAA